MAMQLGISTFTYGWAVGTPGNRPQPPLDEQALLDRAMHFGLSLAQFGDNLPLHELPAERLHELRQRAEKEDITIKIGARGLTQTRLQQYIGIAQTLNSRPLRFVIDEAVNLHLKDFGIRRLPHLMGFQIDGRPAGQGMLDVPRLVAEVSHYERCQTAILEQWVIPEADSATTMAEEAIRATESVKYLKTSGLFAQCARHTKTI